MHSRIYRAAVLGACLAACSGSRTDELSNEIGGKREPDAGTGNAGELDAGRQLDATAMDAQGAIDEDDGALPGDAAAPDADPEPGDVSACNASGQACCAGQLCGPLLYCAGSVCTCIRTLGNSLVIRADGRLLEVGGGSQTVIKSAVTLQSLDGVVSAHRGYFHGCALRTDQTVWCWAAASTDGNTYGELGNGSLGGAFIPLLASQVRTSKPPAAAAYLSGVTALQRGLAGYGVLTNCARKSDGTLWCWGNGSAGVVQNGMSDPAANQIMASPGVPVSDAAEVALGLRHACYRNAAGEVRCWGLNVGGPFGDGNPQSSSVYPVLTLGLTGSTRVVAGADVTCALQGQGAAAGGVFCWGHSNAGEVGIGPPASDTDGCANFCKTTPARVKTAVDAFLADVVDIAGGYQTTCALKADGSVWCWGVLVPGGYAAPLTVQGVAVTDVVQLAMYSSEVRVLKSNGTYMTIDVSNGAAASVNCGLLD